MFGGRLPLYHRYGTGGPPGQKFGRCTSLVFFQGGRASFVPSPFRPRFPAPTSLRRTLLSASLAFQGASGFFPFRDVRVASSPSLLGPGFPNPVRRRTFVRSTGVGRLGEVFRAPGAVSWLCLFGWGSVLLPPRPSPRQSGGSHATWWSAVFPGRVYSQAVAEC